MKLRRLLLPCVLSLLWAASVSFAQSVSGDLTGTIYDPSGATVPNANIAATNNATGVETATVSTNTGDYRISNLPVGTYSLTVTAPGFSKADIKGVAVELNKIATQNVRLEVGQAVETVEVAEAAASLDTTTATVQSTFHSQEMADLPLSAASGVLNLSLLNAGVATSGATGLGTGPSVGGQRPRNNNFTVEGIDNNRTDVTGPVVSLPNDAVSEFTVLQNQFSADFGHSSGGQFNQVIKSGGNDIHGSAYEYFQNRNLNAADNLVVVEGNPPHPRFDDNRFGGSVGGPIKKNKLFYFVNYEYEPEGLSSSGGTVFAPTAAGWSTLASTAGVNQNSLSVLKQYLGTAPAATPASGTPNGYYPVISPGVNQGLTTSNGLAPGTAGTFQIPIGQIGFAAPAFTNNERALASVDTTFSDKDNARFRFALNRQGTIDTNASIPAFFTTSPTNAYLFTMSEYHTFSPTLTNEFRAGYNRYSNITPDGNFKWPGLDQFPNVNVFDLGAQLGPDGNAPQFTYINTYELTDNVIWTKGNHSFKFGFDGNKLISPGSFTQRARGDYEWSYLSDYLFDYYPDYLAERTVGNVIYYGDRITTALYVNDSWKVKPNLTLNLGFRNEAQSVPYSERLQSVNALSSVPGLISFNKPKPQFLAPMPRIGIAYSPGTSGKSSIRAGIGINYDVLYDNLGLLSLPPQFNNTVDRAGLEGSGFLANGGISPNAPAGTLSQADARATTSGFVPDVIRPKSYQWNIGYQRVFHENYTFETRYLGTRGLHLPIQDRLNVQPVVTPQNSLPMYFAAPSQATLNSLSSNLAQLNAAYNAGGYFLPAFLNAGFQTNIVGFMPRGNSTYHGWANQLTRRFSNGLQFIGAYTFSHAIDDTTADVFSTYLTPRRVEDFQNLRLERSSSALDHRQRLTYEVLYDVPFFKHGNWVMKNIVGNWEVAPIYTYQTGTLYTVQSGVDSNLNGDSAGDRTIVNPAGNPLIGSGSTALTNSAGQTVAYLATNPNAMYVVAPKGVFPTGGRQTEHLLPINDIDFTLAKSITLGSNENRKLQFSGRFFNILNHPQYVAGYINDVSSAGINFTGTTQHNFTIPNQSIFNQPSQAFSSNPRSIVVTAKLIF